MTLPALEQWDDTRQGLHQAAQIIGAIRRAVSSPEPNWMHLGLAAIPVGLTTGGTDVGEWILNFAQGKIFYDTPAGAKHELALVGQTQQSLAIAVERTLQAAGFAGKLDHEKLAGNTELVVDLAQAADYAVALHLIWAALNEFRENLAGYKTRLVVWGHGFDAAFLWFSSATAVNEEKDPHMQYLRQKSGTRQTNTHFGVFDLRDWLSKTNM
ncbi:DUF5996 family protein [Chloroflexota bacterium]